MKNQKNWRFLQLFAESAPSGEASADAGHIAAEEGQVAPAEPTTEDAAAPRLSWEQIKADPEYNAHMQAMIRDRLKNSKQAQAVLDKLTPALSKLAKDHGLDPDAPDYDALVEAITASESTQTYRAHFQTLVQQAEALRSRFPGFDLQRELQNPLFARLTAPHMGISLEDAYYTVHRKGIEAAALQVTAQRTAQRISNAIASGSLRPRENGTADRAPSVAAFDYRNASRQQREALKTRIRQAGARGEKIYPGMGI